MSDHNSLNGALAPHIHDGLDDEDDEEQLSLLAESPMVAALANDPVYRGRGRPKGSINRRTRDLANYIRSHHRNPVIGAAQIVDMPLAELAKELSCTLVEALDQWRKCAEFVARYTCQTMPQRVSIDTPLSGFVTVINLNPPTQDQQEMALVEGDGHDVRFADEKP